MLRIESIGILALTFGLGFGLRCEFGFGIAPGFIKVGGGIEFGMRVARRLIFACDFGLEIGIPQHRIRMGRVASRACSETTVGCLATLLPASSERRGGGNYGPSCVFFLCLGNRLGRHGSLLGGWIGPSFGPLELPQSPLNNLGACRTRFGRSGNSGAGSFWTRKPANQ